MTRRDHIDARAAAWVARMGSDQRTREDEAAFRAWMEADPAHARAYADHAALFAGVGVLAGDDEAEQILRGAGAGRRADRRKVLAGGLAAAASVAAGVTLVPILLRDRYRTRRGEQRTISLPDGSTVLLDTDTRLGVDYREDERRLRLDRGQAFFRVAKDAARPFRVFVGDDEVRALGTAFEVRRIGDAARVTLEEGRVAVYRQAQPAAVLRPGQQLRLAAVAAPEAVDLRKTAAWRYGRLILDDAPLGETVADLNRYGGPQIVLADPAMASLRVSGVFHTGRPEAFVESVTAAFPVQVVRADGAEIVLATR